MTIRFSNDLILGMEEELSFIINFSSADTVTKAISSLQKIVECANYICRKDSGTRNNFLCVNTILFSFFQRKTVIFPPWAFGARELSKNLYPARDALYKIRLFYSHGEKHIKVYMQVESSFLFSTKDSLRISDRNMSHAGG